MTLLLNAEFNDDCLPEEPTEGTEGPHDAFCQTKEVDNPPISRDTLVSIPSTPRIRRQLLPLSLSIFYTTLMLFFWVITAILCIKPIKGSGWYDSYSFFGPYYFQDSELGTGFGCDPDMYFIDLQVTTNDRWRRMVRMVSSILSILAIHISSAICSRGAVVYLQNRKQQSLSLHKAITLADAGWSSPSVLASILLSRKKHRDINRYLLLCMFICALGSFLIPLASYLSLAVLFSSWI